MSVPVTPSAGGPGCVPNPAGAAGSPVGGCLTCSITSQTQAAHPLPQDRKRLGIGEKVTLRFSLGSAQWAIAYPSNEGLTFGPHGKGVATPSDFAISDPDEARPDYWGRLSTQSAPQTQYTAPVLAPRDGKVTIEATGAGCTASITFDIIEPQYIVIKNATGLNGYAMHDHNSQSTGFLGEVYVFPANVSFGNCWYLEDDTCGMPSGDWITVLGVPGTPKFVCYPHKPTSDPTQIEHPKDEISGSHGLLHDKITFKLKDEFVMGKNFPQGELHYRIPCRFGLSDKGPFYTPANFKPEIQIVKTRRDGYASIWKQGATMESQYDDNPPVNDDIAPIRH